MTFYAAPGIKTPEEIICDEFGVTVDDIARRSRLRHIAEPRMVIGWYYMRHRGFGPKHIAEKLNMHHSSIIQNTRHVDDLLLVDKFFRRKVENSLSKINGIK